MALSGTLSGYWSQDESGTGTRADSTANGLTLTNNNSATNGTGALNNATAFVRASSQYLSRASETALQTGDVDWFIAPWFKPTTLTDYECIVSKDENGSNREYGVYARGNGNVYVEFRGIAVFDYAAGMTTGNWYLIVLWHDATNNVFKLSVNDGTVQSAADGAIGAAGTDPFKIGWSFGGNFADGLVDEVAFGKFLPTAGDITLMFGAGVPPGHAALTASSFTATAALTAAPVTTSIAATATPPTFSASSTLSTAPATLSAAGTATPPTFSGSAALVAAPSTLAASGTTDPPVFSASASLAVGAVTSSSAATATPPTFTATADLSAGAAVLAASGTTTSGAVAPAGGLRAREGYALRAREGYALTVREGYTLRAREG